MKKILITGENSYIGSQFKKWLTKWPESYEVNSISVRGDLWKTIDFSNYNVIVHVAGIAHTSTNPKLEKQYFNVNRDLAVEVAEKSKREGVKQFIFMSSIIVYGEEGDTGKLGKIGGDTSLQPKDFYGRSKLEADLAIQKMETAKFKCAIIRSPVVYGPGCRGNFPKLIELSKKTFLFPDFKNYRSMIYIDNLCELLRLCIDNNDGGIFYPQNKEYISTTTILKVASEQFGKKIYFTRTFNVVIRLLCSKSILLRKIFGDKVYDKSISAHYNWAYCVVGLNQSIKKSMSVNGK